MGALLLLAVSCTNYPIGPCDIYEAGGTPCVTAHSTVRILYSKYDGPLYQLLCGESGETVDIYAAKDGYVDVKSHEEFCEGRVCYISVIYDQSGMGNDLFPAPPGTFKGPDKGAFNTMPIADMAPVIVNGHKAYGAYIMPGMGYRNNNARGLAINDEPEGMYSVAEGDHYSSGCCFDYGNVAPNGRAVGTGTMETTYFGTATVWGSGNGDGPWIMADLEAGLFSGYNPKYNDVPEIDNWPFVSIFVNGGGENKWDLRGADTRVDTLTVFYSGIRPHSLENDSYYPMSKRGALVLGNGGDNGNGSAGTFFEGAMTVGYPTEEAIAKVQKNVAAQNYVKYPVKQSRLTSFTLGQAQELVVGFTNTGEKPVSKYEIAIELPESWVVEGGPVKEVNREILPGESYNTTFRIIAPDTASAGYVKSVVSYGKNAFDYSQRVRCASPVKINEVYLSDAKGVQGQYIELYNASDSDVDVSNWVLDARASGWDDVNIATLPANTVVKAKDFAVLYLAPSSLTAPAKKGDRQINLSRELSEQTVYINGQALKIAKKGVPASALTTIFTPITTGPWLSIPKGSTSIPVTDVTGLAPGQLMGIDWGGNYEVVKVKTVGKSATQTNTVEPIKVGQTVLKLEHTSNLEPGSILTISSGQRTEYAEVKRVISVESTPAFVPGMRRAPIIPGEIELVEPLKIEQIAHVDVSCPGGSVTFEPATKYEHKSGDAIQALGVPYELSEPLAADCAVGTNVATEVVKDELLYCDAISASAGSVALYAGDVLVDAIVYGSQQSNSSANGTITSPELATLEGDQHQGGCIAVVPAPSRWPRRNIAPEDLVNILARYPDGNDKDMLCEDFKLIKLATPGKSNPSVEK